jgi:hypothetical protein
MKKIKLFFAFGMVCAGFFLTSCAPKADRCNELYDDVSAAITAFGSNPSEASCNDYKNSISDYYDGCAAIPASTRASLDAALESMDCSVY